jgi:CO dehydrogenase nickel-insertion accessory protein CooC1
LVTRNFINYLENYSYRCILMDLENGIELMSHE